jgi:uncharacterized protein YbjT (DUF2867 family)
LFVIFGASTDIGRRLGDRLTAANHAVRSVSRSSPGSVAADLATGVGMDKALDGAKIVISCAHARFTGSLVAALPSGVQRLILMGSAWRYSHIPNPRADQVRAAEGLFLASGHNGVMLHSTMIYGGRQENNVQRLIKFLQNVPVIPTPGGGRHQVQPIYIDDVVSCLYSAALRDWQGAHVLPIAGPGLTWREMAEHCASAVGRRRVVFPVPATPVIVALECLHRMGVSPIHPDVVRRFTENVDIPVVKMVEQLGLVPCDFASGIKLAVAEWCRLGII